MSRPALPILYSFRRCPYAMRARLALKVSGFEGELREIRLREKPPQMLAASPKGTVPVLVLPEHGGAGRVLEESLEIMLYALDQHDPQTWLAHRVEALSLIDAAEARFKPHLDRYKYASRHAGADPEAEYAKAVGFLERLEERLGAQSGFCGTMGLADFAILPFVRQFAQTDRPRFDALPLPCLRAHLERFEASTLFRVIFRKIPVWQEGGAPLLFSAAYGEAHAS